MLSLEDAVKSVSEKLSVSVPEADAEGGYTFELADDMVLHVRGHPGGEGLLAWAPLGGDRNDADARRQAEEALLKTHLARLGEAPRVVAGSDAKGDLLLFTRLSPQTADEWIDGVGTLLNEAEAAGRALGMRQGGTTPGQGGLMGLYSGMSRLYGR